ncbi:MAG TPA: S8 family serine peptidase [Thermoanaerobaculia bacterium]|nr:S8 family serine peptidase [Thermoanaerobaculia bacterium]
MRRLTFAVLILFSLSAFAVEPPTPRIIDRELERAPHMILNPARPLTPEDRAELRAKGVEVQRPLSGGRYLARVVNPASAVADARITSVERMTAEHKILRSALRHAGKGKTKLDVTVIFHKDVSFDAARSAILAAGGALDNILETRFGPSQRVEARIAPAALNALAADDRVLAIGGRSKLSMVPFNAQAARVSRVDVLHAAPYNLTGAGQVVMVSELSEAQKHVEFGDRITVSGGEPNGQHATHVSGTVGAAGINPDAKGMAPNVTIHEFNVGGSAARHLRILDEQLPALKPISNNTSLGFPLGWCHPCPDGAGLPVWNDEEEYYGAYEAGFGTPAYDDLTIEHGALLVFAAGNDGDLPLFQEFGEHRHVDDDGDPTDKTWCFSPNGSGTDCPASLCTGGCETAKHHFNRTPYDTMTVTGAAKNVLAVGAVHTITATPEITGFSSRGPAKDGRIKPDVVARGQSMLSTIPTNQYGRSQGTSMSSPVVAGIAAVLAEQWGRTFNGARPKPAELRGIILAGARDLGDPGPDYTYGFGLVDAQASADLIIADGGTRSQIALVSIGQGTQIERKVTVAQQQNLRVMVTWSDPSVILLGNDSISAKALVNDIDVRVVDPAGNTHLPYVLDKAQYLLPATRGVNRVDNTELIEIANAMPGDYRVLINGTNVTEGPQEVVVISNARGATILPCADRQEPNNTAETAYGNVPPGQTVSGALCTEGDVDFIKFVVTRFGPVRATITTGDTPLRATLTAANGQTATVDVPVNSTRTVEFTYGSGDAQAPDLNVTLRIEANGTRGSDPRYLAALEFGQFSPPRRRAVR